MALPAHQPLGTCSTGQRRKAELVASLAGDPEVLLLDQPFAALHDAAITTVGGWMAGWRDRVVLIANHDPLPVTPDSVLEL